MIGLVTGTKFHPFRITPFLGVSQLFNAHLQCFFRNKSHYETLGLDSNATPTEIKSAYYKLSMQHHPDRNEGCTESAKKFHEISAAYETLSNPQSKEKYDKELFQPSAFHPDLSDYKPNQRSRASGTRTPPRTGRTSHFNYDEHYEQHYGRYEREKQEYYKRQRTEYMWKSFNMYQNRKNIEEAKTTVFIFFVVLILSISYAFSMITSENRPRRVVYYKTERDKNKDE